MGDYAEQQALIERQNADITRLEADLASERNQHRKTQQTLAQKDKQINQLEDQIVYLKALLFDCTTELGHIVGV